MSISKRSKIKKVVLLLLAWIVVVILSCAISFLNTDFQNVYSVNDKNDKNNLSGRLKYISNNLSDYSSELSIIHTELENEIKYVEDLNKQANIIENFINQSSEQFDSMQTVLNQKIESTSTKSYFQSIALSSLFYFLGILTQYVLSPTSSQLSAKEQTRVIRSIQPQKTRIIQATQPQKSTDTKPIYRATPRRPQISTVNQTKIISSTPLRKSADTKPIHKATQWDQLPTSTTNQTKNIRPTPLRKSTDTKPIHRATQWRRPSTSTTNQTKII